MNQFQDAFISYGRADSKAFAKKLNDRLVTCYLEVWFDFDDIPLGVDYQKQIDDGIEKADNFLYVIAPHSVNSPYCGKEIDLALKRNKRIIPILHVEQISRETWQQRYPAGSEADWEAYTSKGLHSSFSNMHPEIAKINWIYCREGIDDFEQSFARLLEVMERQRTYVHQHTRLLAKALEWERHQKQTRYLLVGDDRKRAEEWLVTRFTDEQPPCLPTDLHCEFISESIKNANNLMTQVFLCWSTEDREMMERIRRTLMRENFTLWVSKTDIKTGADFQKVIDRGIEEADNLVYLISAHSLRSRYCQHEIAYAKQFNKRIIPLLVGSVDLEEIPEDLRSLQFINFSDNFSEEDYQKDFAKLIKILRQDAAYYEEHKILLTKALKWERQHRNPSILLRGYNLRHAESWLKVAKHRDQHQPIALIEEFIKASQQQPAGVSLDVFVSYSRKDSEFARKLNDALQIHSKTTWFDQESIAAGTDDFQREIYQGISSADHFLFILSPSSVSSPYCADEVEYAVKLNKRIITVLYQPIDPATLPPGLASVQWIDFHQTAKDFDTMLSVLLRTLETDPEHLRQHTQLLVRALEWDNKHREESLLLRGRVLREAQEWLLSAGNKSPQPNPLQQEFVTASNAAELQRQRSTLRLQRVGLGIISSISIAAIGLGLFAFKQYRQATRLELQARQENILSQTKTSEALFQSNRVFEALLEAMQAGIKLQQYGLVDSALKAPVVTALQQAVFWVRQSQRIEGHDGIIWEVNISPDGKTIASASADHTVNLWSEDGRLIKQLSGYSGEQMLAVSFSADGQRIAAGGDRGSVVVWQREGWKKTRLKGHEGVVSGVAFSPDGKLLASAGEDGTIRLWNQEGRLLRTLEGHEAAVRSVTFSPDGQTLATASDDRTVRLWRVDGTLLHTFVGHTAEVRNVSFSPDGSRLASASWDETIRLWQVDGTLLRTLVSDGTLVNDVRFSPDGKTIASAHDDKTIKVWTLDGTLITTIPGHSAQVRTLAFNPVTRSLVSAGDDRTLRVWTLDRPLLASLQDHRARVYGVTFSPDDQLLASAGADNTIRLWDRQGNSVRQLKGHESVVWSVNFSPDGKTLVSASSDRTVKLWSRDGQLLKTLLGNAGAVYAAEFSPDGNLIATAGDDRIVRLWRRDGTLLRSFPPFETGILTLKFSPDGKTLATGGWDSQIYLWNLEGKRITTLGGRSGHQGWIYDIAFSHDGQFLLSASYDNTAKLWRRSGELVTTLRGHEDGVVAVEFSHDDRILATASHDNTIKLWTQEGKLITTLRGHRDRVSDVSFSQDGTLLATASEDKTVLLWNLDLQGELNKLLAQGCRWTQDYLISQADAPAEIRRFCENQPPLVVKLKP